MSKEIIVNVGTRETRVALVDSGKLVELHVEREEQVAGSLYKCRVANVLPGMDAAFVEIGLERNAFLYAGDVLPEAGDEVPAVKKESNRNINIKDLLKVNQEVLVQVVKAPRGTKGARVSTRISLPGRYLVLMPEADNIGISRKIEDRSERDRLKKIADKIKPENYGFIVRTEAEGKSDKDLHDDLEFLLKMWAQIQERAKVVNAPGLVHQDLSLIYRTIRDVFSSDVHRMFIDSPADFKKAQELVKLISPRLRSRITLYDDPEPIFEHFSIENEIERLLRRKVWLKSGGHLTIDQTEALTTIDVNTGKFIGSTSLSDTILRTNQEAAIEIARQLRLRDIGGIIIIDFIDMSSSRDRNHVMSVLDKALKKDRTRTKISHISPLGLIEMTRKRTGETISEIISQACPYCQGHGTVLSPESVSIQIERDLKRLASEIDDEAFVIYMHPDVAEYFIGARGQVVENIEKQIRRAIYVRSNSDMHIEKFDIVPGDLQEIERQMLPYRRGNVIECDVVRNPFVSLPRASAWTCDGYMIDLANGGKYVGQKVKARLTKVARSYGEGDALGPIKSCQDVVPQIQPKQQATQFQSQPVEREERRPQPERENRRPQHGQPGREDRRPQQAQPAQRDARRPQQAQTVEREEREPGQVVQMVEREAQLQIQPAEQGERKPETTPVVNEELKTQLAESAELEMLDKQEEMEAAEQPKKASRPRRPRQSRGPRHKREQKDEPTTVEQPKSSEESASPDEQ